MIKLIMKQTYSVRKKSFRLSLIRCLAGVFITFSLSEYMVSGQANDLPEMILFSLTADGITMVAEGKALPIIMDEGESEGVLRAAGDFQTDVERVTGIKPSILHDISGVDADVIIIGTIGQSRLIDSLIANNYLDVSAIKGKWESYLITSIKPESKDHQNAIIIAGSDKRGTIYGIYELSACIGVSPWYWWADVPVRHHDVITVLQGTYTDSPAVKYRGIFINDEAPAFTGWATEKFGGFNHQFYSHVFELILRLKGNFLWPAMWGSAFYDDDTLNPVLADEYGVVIGTSHHEPMMRAHDEWRRYGAGPWNYENNTENLKSFWSGSISDRKDFESVITVGMRGDGDEAMTEGTAISLLERIIYDQRQILTAATGMEPSQIPQAWALYKEVQDYYDEGMEVPDDITLLLCDDNWGNIRRLPRPEAPEREGGYGMYYHFDFVGGPVSYRWLNVSPASRTWEQMNLCYEHGINRIWIVNVGDLKPMEYPIDLFLKQAWNPEEMTPEKLPEYIRGWAEEQFGSENAVEIARLLIQYTRFNYRRTPEMLSPQTYSLFNYREAERVVSEYNELLADAIKIKDGLPAEYKDAFYQLVMHPIEACANLNELYYTVARNRLYASQQRAATNALADKAEELFSRDSLITDYFHTQLSGGKWNHFMSQTHIGYTTWNSPDKNYMPEVRRIQLPESAGMGIMIDGDSSWWPHEKKQALLPEFDNLNRQVYYIELFNRGTGKQSYKIHAEKPWIVLSETEGEMVNEKRIWVSIDWQKLKKNRAQAGIEIIPETGPRFNVTVKAIVHRPADLDDFTGYVEANGYVSIEAEHFASKNEIPGMRWKIIPGFGRTLSGVSVFPDNISGCRARRG